MANGDAGERALNEMSGAAEDLANFKLNKFELSKRRQEAARRNYLKTVDSLFTRKRPDGVPYIGRANIGAFPSTVQRNLKSLATNVSLRGPKALEEAMLAHDPSIGKALDFPGGEEVVAASQELLASTKEMRRLSLEVFGAEDEISRRQQGIEEAETRQKARRESVTMGLTKASFQETEQKVTRDIEEQKRELEKIKQEAAFLGFSEFDAENGGPPPDTNQKAAVGGNALDITMENAGESNSIKGGVEETLLGMGVDTTSEEGQSRLERTVNEIKRLLDIDTSTDDARALVNSIQDKIDAAENKGFLPRFLEAFALVFGGQSVQNAMRMMEAQRMSVIDMQLKQLDIIQGAEHRSAKQKEAILDKAIHFMLASDEEEVRGVRRQSALATRAKESMFRVTGRLNQVVDPIELAMLRKEAESGVIPSKIAQAKREARHYARQILGPEATDDEVERLAVQQAGPAIVSLLRRAKVSDEFISGGE